MPLHRGGIYGQSVPITGNMLMYSVTQATRALALWLATGRITQAQYCAAMAKLASLPDNAEVTL